MDLTFLTGLLLVLLVTGLVIGLLWYIWFLHESRQSEVNQFLAEYQRLNEEAANERKDLYDRLQAGTLPQYKEHLSDPDNNLEEVKDDGIMDLEEAKDEITNALNDNG